MPKIHKIKFDLEFSRISRPLAYVVQSMLEFNPGFRESAKELLRNPIFDKVRNAAKEAPASSCVNLEIDKKGSFSYTQMKSELFQEADYIQLLKEEVAQVECLL
mmetsp:Transcript_3717/g.5608  ORF Transcript_3717/g.5608 Transcript_3717/m.5608 type:complete len:104 (-) Transcript_3717:16-327(-)